jgi:hypothetical protein
LELKWNRTSMEPLLKAKKGSSKVP